MFFFKQNSIEKLQKALKSAKNFQSTIYVEVDGAIKVAQITSDEYCKHVRSYLFASPGCLTSKHMGHDTIALAFSELVNLLPNAKIFPESVLVISEQKNLADLARDAWCHAFKQPQSDASKADKSKCAEEYCQSILRDNLWPKLTGGEAGIQQWNSCQPEMRRQISYENSKLDGAMLKGVNLSNLHFENSNFDEANLESAVLFDCTITAASFYGTNLAKADMAHAHAENANFSSATMKGATLYNANLCNAKFKNTDLRKADLRNSQLFGTDLTSAILDGAKFSCATYDETTLLPPEFFAAGDLFWRGDGPDPYEEMVKEKIKNLRVETFEEMLKHVKAHFEAARIDKALKMLKKERFQLFSEIEGQSVIGVVKSQTDPDLTYACSLSADGEYTCCTQNLRPCGGLKGALCKHLLVLVVGLARAEQIDLTDATKWILTSLESEPSALTKKIKSAMSEIFLKYNAASAGEIDWRPTETIPEDYYTF
ncbi:MAG: pentapeptide repeat-containing protein [Cyanobacteria bacterium SZAS-4]|nr:pentapeptide repeat-containing protein [Cyanobacteria bacterium SZAS-4]